MIKLNIIDDREELRRLGMPDKHGFAMRLTNSSGQSLLLSENVAAMVHGVIRGAWARFKGEELPAPDLCAHFCPPGSAKTKH